MTDGKLISLADVEHQPVDWFWLDRIPYGGITIIEGDPGSAKSTLTYDLAARCTNGGKMPFCNDGKTPAGVVLLQAEDSLGRVVLPSLKAAGADISRIRVYDQNAPLFLPAGLGVIEAAAEQVQARLIVIDPLSAFLAGGANCEQEVRRALQPLANLAQKFGAAVVPVRHLAKSPSGNAIYRGIGSIAFTAVARSVLLAAPDPTTDDIHQHVLALVKSNLSTAPALSYRTIKNGDAVAIEWIGEAKCTAGDLAGTARREHSALMEAMYVLYSVLANGPLWADDVPKLAARAGVSRRTLFRAKAILGVRSRKRGGGPRSRWSWELPDPRAAQEMFKQRELDDLMDQLVNGHLDPPVRGADRDRFDIDGDQAIS